MFPFSQLFVYFYPLASLALVVSQLLFFCLNYQRLFLHDKVLIFSRSLHFFPIFRTLCVGSKSAVVQLVSCLFTLEAVLAQLPASQSISCSGLSGRGISVNSFLRPTYIPAIFYLTIFAHIREGHLTAFFWQNCPFVHICSTLFLGPL